MTVSQGRNNTPLAVEPRRKRDKRHRRPGRPTRKTRSKDQAVGANHQERIRGRAGQHSKGDSHWAAGSRPGIQPPTPTRGSTGSHTRQEHRRPAHPQTRATAHTKIRQRLNTSGTATARPEHPVEPTRPPETKPQTPKSRRGPRHAINAQHATSDNHQSPKGPHQAGTGNEHPTDRRIAGDEHLRLTQPPSGTLRRCRSHVGEASPLR